MKNDIKKEDLHIAGTGHRFFIDDVQNIKNQIKTVLLSYTARYNVIVHTCFAIGADQLITEVALELGLKVCLSLPMQFGKYVIDQFSDAGKFPDLAKKQEEILRMESLYKNITECIIVNDEKYLYLNATKDIISKCTKLIALWDGSVPKITPEGGTYDCITRAIQKGMVMDSDIHIIKIKRF